MSGASDWLRLPCPLHGELLYGVLAQLDLGADAASLHRPELPERPWTGRLLRAYRAAPGRLVVQGLALYCDDVAGLRSFLRPGAISSLADDAGRELARRLGEALDDQQPTTERRMAARAADADLAAHRARTRDWLAPQLGRLREALWRPRAAPGLTLLDCPSLADARHPGRPPGRTHGRAGTRAGRRVLALSLDGDRELALCQALHEEVHAVSDPEVLADHAPAALGGRDTRAGSAGHALHRELERAALHRGQRLIDEHAPELRAAYRRWGEPFGLEHRSNKL